jgi:hypothetical protein
VEIHARMLRVRARTRLVPRADPEQPFLFEMKEDFRLPSERTAAGRYSEPSLFAFVEREG